MQEIKAGVYRYHGRYYLFDKLIRLHHDDSVWITYTPLWVDPQYVGPRTSARPVSEFLEKFEYVGPTYEGEPVDESQPICDDEGS